MDDSRDLPGVPLSMPKLLAIGAIAVLMGLVVRDAWVSDDAYITLRTIDNLVTGHGLRWNLDERVQSYTHPLWMFLLSAVYFVTREDFFTLIGAGLATSFAALLMLTRSARTAGHAVVAVGLLGVSRSFVEYSTSGLENPLTHLLVAVFVYHYAVRRRDDLMLLSGAAALLALNRLDSLLVVLPALVHVALLGLRKRGPKRALAELALGFLPLLVWELFSLFYYGFLVPNTAFAKLNTGLPRAELAVQGFTYLLNAVSWDPPTLVVIAAAIIVAFSQKSVHLCLLALGVFLYLLYVVWIGGDFMLGRFLTLPLFLAVCVVALSSLPLEEPSVGALLVLPFLFFFWHPAATERYPVGELWHSSGVADERAFYKGAQLMLYTRLRTLPEKNWVDDGREARRTGRTSMVFPNVGFLGYFAGPKIHIIDPLALTEPLLAHLPGRYTPDWRVGHYHREVPAGFEQTVNSGKCEMTDKNLCEYYSKLKQIISGDLWSWGRFKTIASFNFGAYDYLIDRDRCRYPYMGHDTMAGLRDSVAENSASDGPGTHAMTDHGVEIALDAMSHAHELSVSLDGDHEYYFEFRQGDVVLETVASGRRYVDRMYARRVAPSKQTREAGFDRLRVRPGIGSGKHAIGHLQLLP